MNELEIRKIAKEEFISNVMNNLDSALIFTYIQNLEQKVNNLQSKIDKARKIIDRYSRVVDYDDEVSIDVLYEIDDILKEADK